MNKIKELIYAIKENNSNTKEIFNNIMIHKVSKEVGNMRKNVANNFFNKS